ncbi:hypothetical protein ACFQOZ_20345 [Comamonas endophytica]
MPPASVQEAEAAPPAARKPRAATTKSEARNGLNKGRAKLIAAVEKQRILDLKVILGELEKPALQAIYDEYNATLGVEANRIKIGRNRAGVLPSFHAWYARKLWGEEVTDAEIVAMMERMLSA